jgi:uncharacterized protein YjhX (UPF0386 family)
MEKRMQTAQEFYGASYAKAKDTTKLDNAFAKLRDCPPALVAAVLHRLSRSPLQRQLVRDGCIHGDFTMATVRALKRKGLFHLVISSPNGQCGFMELTPLGEAVRAELRAREGERSATEPPQKDTEPKSSDPTHQSNAT